jgi:hypothetical protein
MKRILVLLVPLLLLSPVGGCKTKTKTKRGSDKNLKALQQSGKELKANASDLLKRRGKLQTSRKQIDAARKVLETKRSNLAKDDIEGHAKLVKEEIALKKKETDLRQAEGQVNDKLMGALRRQEQFFVRATAALQAKSTSGGGDATSNVRGREHGVALREKAVARREKAVAVREKGLNDQYRKIVDYKAKKCAVSTTTFTTISAPSMPTSGGGRNYSKADAKAAYARAMSTMSGKGIRISDLPSGFAKLISSIKKFIHKKEYARAKIGADQLRATLRSIKINRGFVGAKMGRLAAYIRRKKLSAAKREKVNKLFVQVTTAFTDGRFASANGKINRIYGVIR